MKRLSHSKKIHLCRIQALRWKRKLKNKIKRIAYIKGTGTYSVVHIEVPKHLDFKENYHDTSTFLLELQNTALNLRKYVLLDFSQCEKVCADAGIVLAAEVERCKQLRSRRNKSTIYGTYPNNDEAESFLEEIGFYKHIGIQERKKHSTTDESGSRYIQIKSGIRDKGEIVHTLNELVFGDIVKLDPYAQKRLYSGLVEAMNNVTKHAYYRNSQKLMMPTLVGRWWIAGFWNRETKEIMAFIYDQGVGIPNTLPETHPTTLQKLQSLLGLKSDHGELIKLAMEIGRTKTKKIHRGKGMADLLKFIELSHTGHLRILSDRGEYLYTKEGETCREEFRSNTTPLNGTFIEWRIHDRSIVTWPHD